MDGMRDKQYYEERFNRLLERGRLLHVVNKKRIKVGLILLVVFTVGMILIRLITDSDRATFLIIWVIGMFAISIYLIGIEYIDSSIERTLEEVTERESGWDDLILDSESARGIVQNRIDERLGERRERLNERRGELQERYQPRRGTPAEDAEEPGDNGQAPESGDEV